MSFLKWVTVGAVGYFINSQTKKYEDFLDIEHEYYYEKGMTQEINRLSKVNNIRRQTPCLFVDGLSFSKFESLATIASRMIDRIIDITVQGALVIGKVESRSRASNWLFTADFNNWGHIDGSYWLRSENDDSTIPKHYGEILSGLIRDFLERNNKKVTDFANFVDRNKELGTEGCLYTTYKNSRLKRLFKGKAKCVNMSYDAEYYHGEHIYPVISMLKQMGFVNIKSVPVPDIDNNNDNYVYEVEKISINNIFDFNRYYSFPNNAEVIIYYHTKNRFVYHI